MPWNTSFAFFVPKTILDDLISLEGAGASWHHAMSRHVELLTFSRQCSQHCLFILNLPDAFWYFQRRPQHQPTSTHHYYNPQHNNKYHDQNDSQNYYNSTIRFVCTSTALFGLSIERPYLMIRLKCWFQWNAYSISAWNVWNAHISLWNAQNSWFPLKSFGILRTGDWRLSRKTYKMCTFHAFHASQYPYQVG